MSIFLTIFLNPRIHTKLWLHLNEPLIILRATYVQFSKEALHIGCKWLSSKTHLIQNCTYHQFEAQKIQAYISDLKIIEFLIKLIALYPLVWPSLREKFSLWWDSSCFPYKCDEFVLIYSHYLDRWPITLISAYLLNIVYTLHRQD